MIFIIIKVVQFRFCVFAVAALEIHIWGQYWWMNVVTLSFDITDFLSVVLWLSVLYISNKNFSIYSSDNNKVNLKHLFLVRKVATTLDTI